MSKAAKTIAIPMLVLIFFCLGFFAGKQGKPSLSSFHDIIVNHPRSLSALITPNDDRVMALALELQTSENAYTYVRNVIGNDPSLPAQQAGEIIEEKRASCLGKAVLLCSLYRAMGIPHESVRVVTGEIESPYGIVDHAWIDLEYYGVCLQQDTTNLIGNFTKAFAECPVACRGDECMPCTEGYKGGVKSPLSA